MKYNVVLVSVFLMFSGCGGGTKSTQPGVEATAASTIFMDTFARTITLDRDLPAYATLDNATISKVILFERGFGLAAMDTSRVNYSPNTNQIIYSDDLSPPAGIGSETIKIPMSSCEPVIADLCVIPTPSFLNTTAVRPRIIGGCDEIVLQCEAAYKCRVDIDVSYAGFSLAGETTDYKRALIECL